MGSMNISLKGIGGKWIGKRAEKYERKIEIERSGKSRQGSLKEGSEGRMKME